MNHRNCLKFRGIVGVGVCCSCLFFGANLQARVTSVSGQASLAQSFESNIYHTKNDHIDEWITEFLPTLSLSSRGSSDNIQLSFNPEFGYNHRRDSWTSSQNLAFSADKQLSSKWKFSLNDTYKYSDNLFGETVNAGTRAMRFLRADESAQRRIVEILFKDESWPVSDMLLIRAQLQSKYDQASASEKAEVDSLLAATNDPSRRKRYWSNTLGFNTTYDFAKGSVFTTGYTNKNFDNRTDDQTDSNSHSPYVNVIYEVNSNWTLDAGYVFTSTDYDNASSNDSDSNDLNAGFTYRLNEKNTLSGGYDIKILDYDGDGRDQSDQSLSGAWQRSLDQHTILNLDAEGTYLDRDGTFDERGGSLGANFSKSFDNASILVSGALDMMHANQNGDWGRYSRDFDISASGNYVFSSKISANADISYGKRTTWVSGLHNTFDDIGFGVGFSYVLQPWLTMSLSYDYALLNTDSDAIDDYHSHKVMLAFSASDELWRW